MRLGDKSYFGINDLNIYAKRAKFLKQWKILRKTICKKSIPSFNQCENLKYVKEMNKIPNRIKPLNNKSDINKLEKVKDSSSLYENPKTSSNKSNIIREKQIRYKSNAREYLEKIFSKKIEEILFNNDYMDQNRMGDKPFEHSTFKTNKLMKTQLHSRVNSNYKSFLCSRDCSKQVLVPLVKIQDIQ